MDSEARRMKRPEKQSQLRIIGGQWRGRKLSFTPAQGLRPTTDRVRETLFNWLAPHIQGARCLDLFAGSGALGLEALSRGAERCDFVDTSTRALGQIETHLEMLKAETQARCHCMPALRFLPGCERRFDIVFIDPPFGEGLIEPACTVLAERALLASDALVYVESASGEPCPLLPPGWTLHRHKVASGVAYRLLRVDAQLSP